MSTVLSSLKTVGALDYALQNEIIILQYDQALL